MNFELVVLFFNPKFILLMHDNVGKKNDGPMDTMATGNEVNVRIPRPHSDKITQSLFLPKNMCETMLVAFS